MSKNWTFITSNYRESWLAFRRSPEYTRISDNLKNSGYKQPYRDNVIKEIFAAGFRASGVKIEVIKR